MAISIVATRSSAGALAPTAPVTAIVATEHAGGRTIDLTTRQQSTQIDTVVTVGSLPQNVTFWKSTDNGITFVGIGWAPITTVGQVWNCTGIVPELPQSWKMAACSGVRATSPIAIPASALPAGTVISASIAIPGVSQPSATAIPALTVSAGVGGSFPYNQLHPDGGQYWSIPSIAYNDTAAVVDQASFFIRITGQDLDSSHAAIGPEQPFAGTYPSTTGVTQTFGPLMGDYLANGITYLRAGNIAYVRLRVYACNRIDGTSLSYSNPSAATLQMGIGGGAGYLDVLVAAGGAQPAGKIAVDRIDSGSFPAAVTSITVSGTVDPISGRMTFQVSAPQPTGANAAHLYLELPDQSSEPAMTLGVSTLGSDTLTGPWSPIDLGVQSYSAVQPWTVTAQCPSGTDPTTSTPARLYVSPVSSVTDAPLVQSGQAGATPSQTFTLISTSSSSASGTNVVATSGPIAVEVLTADSSTGVILFPIKVTVSSVPNVPGWTAQLVVTWQGADPTDPKNQSVVTGVFTGAGQVLGSPDSISTPHSFTLTSKTIQIVTVWLQAGLMDANGNYQWNSILPGITPSGYATIGSINGRTIDGTAITPWSIAVDHFASGLRPVSIFTTSNPALPDPNYPAGSFGYNITTSQFVKVNAAGTAWIAAVNGGADIQAGTVTALQIDATILNAAQVNAAFVTTSYLTATYLTATQIVATYASFTYLSANYITATTLAATYVTSTYLTANYATIGALNAKTISANNITTGTISVSVTLTAAIITGGSITGTSLTLNTNGATASIANLTTLVVGGWTGPAITLTDNSSRKRVVILPTMFVAQQDSASPLNYCALLMAGDGATLPSACSVYNQTGAVGAQIQGGSTVSSPLLAMSGNQVVTIRQAGPGSPSFGTLGNAQTWCAALLTALRTHGLIT